MHYFISILSCNNTFFQHNRFKARPTDERNVTGVVQVGVTLCDKGGGGKIGQKSKYIQYRTCSQENVVKTVNTFVLVKVPTTYCE